MTTYVGNLALQALADSGLDNNYIIQYKKRLEDWGSDKTSGRKWCELAYASQSLDQNNKDRLADLLGIPAEYIDVIAKVSCKI